MLWGREKEQAAIDRLMASTRAGEGGGLAVVGEPGMGKSALLAYAGGRAEGARVLRASGTEAESALAFAVLHQLMHPVLDRVERLPEPQAKALAIALGLETGPAPDRFLVSVAVLTLVSDVAAEQPVLCVVDDLQWADDPSAEVLAFVARRLHSEPIALLAATRTGEVLTLPAGLGKLRLTGLTAEAAGALLDARFPDRLIPALRDRLYAATAGNPLALIEISGTLTERQLAGHDPIPDPLPLTGQLEQVFVKRVRQRKPASQTLVLLCAAEGSGRLSTVYRAAASLDLDPAPLESGELADLVRVDGSTVVFRHPLMRSAAYHGASPLARRAAHTALADALTDEKGEIDRRAWHRAQAAADPDEEIARELERSAERTLRRSGHTAAATALQRAAELSPAEQDRARRMVAAAEAAWLGGETRRARHLLDRVERLEAVPPAVYLHVQYVRGSIELRSGVVPDALAILLPAAAKAVEVDPHLCVRMLIVAGEAAFHTSDAVATREIDRLMESLPHVGDDHDSVLVRLFLSVAPITRGEDPPTLYSDLARAEEMDDPHLLVRAGGVVFAQGDYAFARRLRTKGVTRARNLGAAGTLAWALWYQANDEMLRGHHARAEALAHEGHELALETGQPNLGWQHQATLTSLAAVRGRKAETRRLADEIAVQAGARRLTTAMATARGALARLALAEGHGEEAVQHLEVMHGLMSTSHHGVAFTVIPDYVEAAVRAGLPERGRDLFARFLQRAHPTGAAQALAARSQALLTVGEEADRWFREALRLHAEAPDLTLGHARTALLYGEFLRRERRRVDARVQLRTALETFERLGASAWARRARRELRATGETARKRDPSTFDQLTPQELQVAHAVGHGATNREVAAQLFISPRTVDGHLRKVFSKLQISSRTELIRLVLAQGDLDDAS